MLFVGDMGGIVGQVDFFEWEVPSIGADSKGEWQGRIISYIPGVSILFGITTIFFSVAGMHQALSQEPVTGHKIVHTKINDEASIPDLREPRENENIYPERIKKALNYCQEPTNKVDTSLILIHDQRYSVNLTSDQKCEMLRASILLLLRGIMEVLCINFLLAPVDYTYEKYWAEPAREGKHNALWASVISIE